MNNSLVAARRAAFQTVAGQAVVTLMLALAFWLLSGSDAALATLVGGGAVALGSALMAWRAFGGGVTAAGATLMRLLGGMALKSLVVLAALYWALAKVGLPPLPLLVGLSAALVVPILNFRKQA